MGFGAFGGGCEGRVHYAPSSEIESFWSWVLIAMVFYKDSDFEWIF